MASTKRRSIQPITGMNQTRRQLLAMGIGVLASPHLACAQPAEKMRVIGYLTLSEKPSLRDEIFLQGMRDLGWIEGKNIRIETRRAGNDVKHLAALAQELVRWQSGQGLRDSLGPAHHQFASGTRTRAALPGAAGAVFGTVGAAAIIDNDRQTAMAAEPQARRASAHTTASRQYLKPLAPVKPVSRKSAHIERKHALAAKLLAERNQGGIGIVHRHIVILVHQH